jgi:polar amino acid transport system substrate-binding protein
MNKYLPPIFVSMVVSLLVCVVAFSFFHANQSQSLVSQTYPHIQSSGVVRAAYVVGAPLFTIDPNTGQKSGIFYDIVTAAATHLGLKVEWTQEVGYGQMTQDLNSGKYDIVGSGVWINSNRAKNAVFTIPVYYDAVFAYARAGDTRFTSSLSNLNSPQFIISTMDGELGTMIAQSDFPKAKTLQLPQNADFSQMIQNVISGKADIVFLSASAARAYQATNPGKIVAVDIAPIQVFPDAVMLPEGQYELQQTLNYALMEMQNDGEINKILAKYAPSGSFLPVAAPYQTGQ